MDHETARKQGLIPCYPENHELGDRIFFEPSVTNYEPGRFYDNSVDHYINCDNIMVPNPTPWTVEKNYNSYVPMDWIIRDVKGQRIACFTEEATARFIVD